MIQITINGSETILNSPFKCNLFDTCKYKSAVYRRIIDEEACSCSGDLNSTTGYCSKYINQVEGMFESLIASIAYTTSTCSGPKAHTSDPYWL